MAEAIFKTPRPCKLNTEQDMETPRKGGTDSDTESIGTVDSNSGSRSSDGEISLVAEFDDLVRCYDSLNLVNLGIEEAFLSLIEQTKYLNANYGEAANECKRLQALLDCKIHEISDLEAKLLQARKLVDKERANAKYARKQRDDLATQINHVKNLLFSSTSRISDEMQDKLSFLHNYKAPNDYQHGYQPPQLSAIKEINSTGSILSDFSYSRSDDDLDACLVQNDKSWRKHRPSTDGLAEPAFKKRRSSGNKAVEIGATDTVRATTTLTVSKDGPITATSVIESVPKTPKHTETIPNGDVYPTSAPPANLIFESWARETPPVKPARHISGRQHCFQSKTVVMPDTCGVCDKRIRFGKSVFKCKECKAICHTECKDNLPLPCIPLVSTPTGKTAMNVIGDYTPTIPPMVPPLLIHSINEIEMRGLSEVGIYRVPGAERDVRTLKEKFLKGKGTPCLKEIDVHVICGMVKDFLRSLSEPLVTYGLWKTFIKAAECKDPIDRVPALYQAIGELPQPNRDTLAYMVLHLQRVSEARECKMNVSNLAKIFGPTIVGYSSADPNPATLLDETIQQNNVMEQLINISTDYWSVFINVDHNLYLPKLQQTPSTDSLLHSSVTRGFTTPTRPLTKRNQKYFPSPF